MFTARLSSMPHRAVIYARISVTKEESVSVDRQLEAARQYAASRGWEVVEVFTDDGVSATHNSPQARSGWTALLSYDRPHEYVIVWKIDRVARRIRDFWDAVTDLQDRGRALVSIGDNLDMSSTVGQIVAGVLAGFAQLEAEAISDRVTAARRHLLQNGRLPGGTVPYGWRTLPNPDGAGKVLAQDPERIEYVRGAADRVRGGATLYSVVQWLDEVGAPLPRASQSRRKSTGWAYTTVERLLRNPVLAGMVSFNPGNSSKMRGSEVLRDENGLPVVDPAVAVMTPSEWRAMVAALDNNDSPRAKPHALRAKTSALLSGLVWCGHCEDSEGHPVRMHRGTTQGRESYSCPRCHQTISRIQDYVVEQFLWAKGEHVRWTPVREVHESGAAVLPEIEARLDELDAAIRDAPDRAARRRLQEQQDALLDLRDQKRAEAPRTVLKYEDAGFFAQAWAEAEGVEAQRAVLNDALERITVRRGRTGRGLDKSRLTFSWRHPDQVGPLPEPSQEELARWAEG